MTAEDQVRDLLTRACDLPDLAPAPVAAMVARARRRRRGTIAIGTTVGAAAAIVTAAALTVPLTSPTQPSIPAGPGLFGGSLVVTPPGPPATSLARFRWSGLAASPLGARTDPLTVWTGTELIELGGTVHETTVGNGAGYVPATGRWHRIPAPPGTVGLADAVTAWTGHLLFVANGQTSACAAGASVPDRCLPSAGLYDPAANRWTSTRLPRQMRGLELQAATWTGRDVVIAGVDQAHGRLGVAAYDPAARLWRMITPGLPAGHPAGGAALVATPGRLILWSLWAREKKTKDGGSIYFGVDVLALRASGTWTSVTGRWPQNRVVSAPAFTGSSILVSPGGGWCGQCPGPYVSEHGYFADAATLARHELPLGPLGETNPPFVWTGRSVLAVNLNGSVSGANGRPPQIKPGDIAVWDAATGWHTLPHIPGRPSVSALPVWTGSALLVLTDHGNLLSLHH
jgi:hypothetical protein